MEVARHPCAVGEQGPASMWMGLERANATVTGVYAHISAVIRRTRCRYGGIVPLAWLDRRVSSGCSEWLLRILNMSSASEEGIFATAKVKITRDTLPVRPNGRVDEQGAYRDT